MDRTSTLDPSASKTPPGEAVLDAIRGRFQPFEIAPIGILVVDRRGKILLTNGRLDAIFGYAPGELSGMPVESLIPSELRQRHNELRDAFLEYPVTRQMSATRDLFGWSKNGRPVPVEVGLSTLEADGERFVLAFVLDLTHRKKQDEKFRLVVDAAPNGLFLVDVAGRIALANGQACSMFGYSQEELLDQPVEKLMPERFRLKHRVYRGSFTQAPESRLMGGGRELYGQRKDGSEFPIEIGLTPINVDDGRFIVSTVIDITERKRSEEEIREKNAELSRLNEELSAFSFSVSHDLKAPLSAIVGLAAIAGEDLESNEQAEVRANLRKITSQAERLRRLIENVLALARSESEQEWAPTRVCDVVREVVETFTPFAEAEGVALRTDLPGDLVVVTQGTRLGMIVKNLVSNAIRYADPGKPERFVEVSLEDLGAEFELRVRDNGLGIPAECREQVFGMFRRFHPERVEGSGLGLALVKKQVLRLGGTVEFDSSPAGSTFRIRLPRSGEHDVEHSSGR